MPIWPQLLIIILFVLKIINCTINHEKIAQTNAYTAFAFVILWGWILYEGGFWNVLIQ